MIQVFRPQIGEEEVQAVRDVLLSGWLGLGPKTEEFEREFSEYIGSKYTIGVNSATSALDLSLKLLNIQHGDEVIVPTMTFVSTAHVVAYNMATPVFTDVDPDTLNMDIDDVESKITGKTKAIIPVHYGGRPVDMDRLRDVAGNIPVIEDAAHACGSTYKGRRTGTLGLIGCFSFHAVKNLCTGDGGALTLDNPDLAERAKRLRWLGIDKGTWDRTDADESYWWEYYVDEIGLKCHMNDVTAALGIVQLRKLDKMNRRRAEIAEKYTKVLKECDMIKVPPELPEDQTSSWHIYCVRAKQRNELSTYLRAKNIATGVHYKPIHLYKCYGSSVSLPVAEGVFDEILSLPVYPDLTDDEVDYIIDSILLFYA